MYSVKGGRSACIINRLRENGAQIHRDGESWMVVSVCTGGESWTVMMVVSVCTGGESWMVVMVVSVCTGGESWMLVVVASV